MRVTQTIAVVLVAAFVHEVTGRRPQGSQTATTTEAAVNPAPSTGSGSLPRVPKAPSSSPSPVPSPSPSPSPSTASSPSGETFFHKPAGETRPITSLTCQDITCPGGATCRMEDGVCGEDKSSCTFPLCVRGGGSTAPKVSTTTGSPKPQGGGRTRPAVTSSADNPGTCPMSAVDVQAGCAGQSVISCTDDSSCSLNQKCCIQDCSFRCVNVTSMERAIFMTRMRSFSRSRPMAGFRFQPNSRTRTRQFSTSDMSLFCPTVPSGAFSNGCGEMKSCTADSDCGSSQKCCYFPCGKVCVNSVSIVSLANVQNRRAINAMRARAAAEANATASSNASAPAMAATASKNGVCPTMAVDVTVANVTECAVDADCSGAMKCCAHGQGLGCMAPLTFMTLPSALMSTRLQAESNGGNNHNVLRARSVCPNVDFEPGMTCGTACTADGNCTDTQLCCSVGECLECLNPVISQAFVNARPGMCPSFSPDIVTTCVVDCKMDSDCNVDGMKCCSVGCAKKCVNPIATMAPTSKSGSCPAVTLRTGAPRVKRTFGSRSFKQARGFPIATRRHFPGSGASRDPNGCGFRRFTYCRVDNQCSGNLKCCENSCGGMMCMGPA